MRAIPCLVFHLTLASCVAGCTTTRDSVVLGLGVGGILGAGVGAAAGQNSNVPLEGAAVGLAVGAALGGLMGYFKHKDTEDAKLRSTASGASASLPPALTQPRIERVWVPARIENNVYVEGHYQFVIEQPSRWSPENQDADKSPSKKGRQK